MGSISLMTSIQCPTGSSGGFTERLVAPRSCPLENQAWRMRRMCSSLCLPTLCFRRQIPKSTGSPASKDEEVNTCTETLTGNQPAFMLSNECIISLVGGVAVRKDLGDAQDISTLSTETNLLPKPSTICDSCRLEV